MSICGRINQRNYMPDQASIFDSNSATQPNQQPAANSNAAVAPNINNDYADLLASIKNERGEQKYKTMAEALVGTQHAQNYIQTLKAEQAQKDAEIERLRVEAARAAALEESLSALTSQQAAGQPQAAPQFDENKLADLVNQTLSKREQLALEQANQKQVVSILQQSFGADAEKKFYDKAAELGMTVQEMNALAAKSPKMVLTALGIAQAATKQTSTSPQPSTVNTSAFTPQEGSFVGRNPKQALVGATTQEIRESMDHAKKMVDELHSKGMSVHALTDPKIYNQYFNRK